MKDSKTSKNGLLTMLSITIVNILNYGLNLILGRWLGPEGFAEANIIATLILMISFLGIAIQLTVANEVARSSSSDSKKTLTWIEKRTIRISYVLMVLVIITASITSEFLNLSKEVSIVVIAISIPFYFILSARRGYLQGIQDFKTFSLTYIIETFGRISATLLLLYLAEAYTINWTTEIIALGFLVSFVFGSLFTIKKINLKGVSSKVEIKQKDLIIFIGVITIYELSQILINNFDVILTKHFFTDLEAGLYSSIALVGRIVFFGTWTIVTLLFPKVIEKEKKGEAHQHFFYGALGLVLAGGLIITLSCASFDHLIINTLFGNEYISISHLLWKYALATTLFASANVFAYYYMSLKNYLPVFISFAMGLLQIYLVFIFHSSLDQVVYVQIFSMSMLLILMLSFHVAKSFSPKRNLSKVLKPSF